MAEATKNKVYFKHVIELKSVAFLSLQTINDVIEITIKRNLPAANTLNPKMIRIYIII